MGAINKDGTPRKKKTVNYKISSTKVLVHCALEGCNGTKLVVPSKVRNENYCNAKCRIEARRGKKLNPYNEFCIVEKYPWKKNPNSKYLSHADDQAYPIRMLANGAVFR